MTQGVSQRERRRKSTRCERHVGPSPANFVPAFSSSPLASAVKQDTLCVRLAACRPLQNPSPVGGLCSVGFCVLGALDSTQRTAGLQHTCAGQMYTRRATGTRRENGGTKTMFKEGATVTGEGQTDRSHRPEKQKFCFGGSAQHQRQTERLKGSLPTSERALKAGFPDGRNLRAAFPAARGEPEDAAATRPGGRGNTPAHREFPAIFESKAKSTPGSPFSEVC